MKNTVKIIFVCALLLGGFDTARDFIHAADAPGSPARIGESIGFYLFVAVTLCLVGYLVLKKLRDRRKQP